jgi:hypothetical protein
VTQGRAPFPADPLLEEAEKAIKWASARFCRAGMPFERGELEGEAWRACLAVRHRYDPARGPAVAYFRTVARRAMGRFCSKALAVVSMGKDYADGARYQTRLEHQDWQHGEIDPRYADEVREHLETSPERVLLAKEYEKDKAGFIACVRSAVEGILEDWEPYDRFLVQRITGLDGFPSERPRELAGRIGCDVRRIYKAHARLEREMWGHTGLVLLHLRGAKKQEGEG